MPNMLVEIYTEELPASYIEPALKQMKGLLKEQLLQYGLAYKDLGAEGTLRRLVLFAEDLPEQTPERTEEVQGPPARIAFPGGRPSKAAEGFARKFGLSPEELTIRETPNGPYCFVTVTKPSRKTLLILAEAVPHILGGVRFPKSMIWNESGFSFARPVRRLTALLGGQVIPLRTGGLQADRTTVGHPFASPQTLTLAGADFRAYVDLLARHNVVLEYEQRKTRIERRLQEAAARHSAALRSPELIEVVANMVECPTVGEGVFDEEHLSLPDVLLEAAMVEHQRYFPLEKDGRLIPVFLFVVDRPPETLEKVRPGNERVLAARLEDARFHYERDLATGMDALRERLAGMLFHQKLGDYEAKASRLERMAAALAEELSLPEPERNVLREAAALAKADLAGATVAEFPSLQGKVGAELALAANVDERVAQAIREQYLPTRADGPLPMSKAGAALSLAEKFDNVTAFWAAGEAPTGAKDPFAIRRQTIGIVRILEAHDLHVRPREAFEFATQFLPESLRRDDLVEELTAFFAERLRVHLVERGFRHDFAEAVLAAGSLDVVDVITRLRTLVRLSEEDLWRRLCETVERTLKIARGDVDPSEEVNIELLLEEPERRLYERLESTRRPFEELVRAGDYHEASHLYHNALAEVVHDFFDKVFVNVEDEALRKNRMLLSLQVHRLYATRIADLSRIVFASDEPRKPSEQNGGRSER